MEEDLFHFYSCVHNCNVTGGGGKEKQRRQKLTYVVHSLLLIEHSILHQILCQSLKNEFVD